MVALAGNQPANRENKLLPKFSSSVSTLPKISVQFDFSLWDFYILN